MIYDIPVLYINLDKRPDRKIHIENQLSPPSWKHVHRIEAVDTSSSSGYFGCVLSHLKALQYAKQMDWDEVIIFEDDFEWVAKEKFVYPEKNFDVCLIECLYNQNKKKNFSQNYYHVWDAQHTGAYLIKKHFYDTLIQCFTESYENLSSDFKKSNYLDIYWWKIQKDNKFITPKIQIGKQINGYSDIQNKNVKRS